MTNKTITEEKRAALEAFYDNPLIEETLKESVRIAYEILNNNATDFEISELAINMFRSKLIEDTVNLIFVFNDKKEIKI